MDSDKFFQHLGGQVVGSFPAYDESEKQIGDHPTNASCPDVEKAVTAAASATRAPIGPTLCHYTATIWILWEPV
jgi:hypothetical protein